jgi:hypothetical protein
LVIDDLTQLQAAQTHFDVVMGSFYLEREIFPKLGKRRLWWRAALRKVHHHQLKLPGGPKDASHLHARGELLRLVNGMRVRHYRETVVEKATAEMVARKEE